MQVCPLPHVLPHDPQLLLSVCSLTQVPLQSDCPEGQVHVLPEQVPLLHGYEQLLPQTVVHVPMQFFWGAQLVWIVSRSWSSIFGAAVCCDPSDPGGEPQPSATRPTTSHANSVTITRCSTTRDITVSPGRRPVSGRLPRASLVRRSTGGEPP